MAHHNNIEARRIKLFFGWPIFLLFIFFPGVQVFLQSEIQFENFRVVSDFPNVMRYSVDLCNLPENYTVELVYRIGHYNWSQRDGHYKFSAEASCQTARANIDMRGYPPLVSIKYFWMVTDLNGKSYQGPENSASYSDVRFDWKNIKTEEIAVYWHDRADDFGKEVLDISQKAVLTQNDFFDVSLSKPVTIVIQNSEDEFYFWYKAPAEYAWGTTFPSFDITVQIVEPNLDKKTETDWLNDVLPHEISHLYFYKATNSLHSDPPVWLNEGFATYNEFTDHSYETEIVRTAVVEKKDIPLLDLSNGFGVDTDRIDLAYAESYFAAEYIVETYNATALQQLFAAYRYGKSTDEAFMSAFGVMPLEFEANWSTWLQNKFQMNMVEGISQPLTPPASKSNNVSLVILTFLLLIFTLIFVFAFGLLILLPKIIDREK